MNFEDLSELIKSRRSIYPSSYSEKKVDKQTIEKILENANWAPTHLKTEPWRYIVFSDSGLTKLSNYLSEYYLHNTLKESFSRIKHENQKKKPLQSSHVIAICMKRDAQKRIPEWEEIASVSTSVMNMWLSCTSLGLGCYWSSTKAIINADKFLRLNLNERCLGLFYIGFPKDGLKLHSKRQSINEKVIWRF